MTDSAASLAGLLLEQVSRLLRRLEPAQIRELAAERAELAVVPVPAQAPPPELAPAAPIGRGEPAGRPRPPRAGGGLDVEATRDAIMALSDRDEAAHYVAGLGTVAVLRALADDLHVRLPPKVRKADIARRIVDATLGLKLTADAMRDAGHSG